MKKSELKLCADCGKMKKYEQNGIVHRRCFKCMEKIRMEKKRLRKAKATKRKQSSKYYQLKQKKKLHRENWKMMSEIVRREGCNDGGFNQCYSCQKMFPWKELQAGHCWHDKLDFDFDNIKPQCVKCNKYLHGNLGEYERHLIEEYGLEFAQELKKKADRYILYTYKELEMFKSALEKELLNIESN